MSGMAARDQDNAQQTKRSLIQNLIGYLAQMIKKPCKNKCTTTSLAADLICRGCGMSDQDRLAWGQMSETHKKITLVICEFRLDNYDECVKGMGTDNGIYKEAEHKR